MIIYTNILQIIDYDYVFRRVEKIKVSIILIFTIQNCGTHNLSTKVIKSEGGGKVF